MWARGTEEREFGLLPTPMASDRTDHKAEYNRNAESQSGRTLTLYARKYPNPRFPTPTHAMYKQDVNDSGRYAEWVKEKGHQISLPTAVKLLPTPTAADSWTDKLKSTQQKEGSKHSINLSQAVHMKKLYPSQNVKKETGTLNPMWVEWLMGYPEGWTDLKD